jgi:hypothetical protein
MIGRWTPFPLSSMFCITLEWFERVMIAYVGCPQKDLLMSNNFIRFFFLTVFPLSLGRAFGGVSRF